MAKILIVEDDGDIAAIERDYLEAAGHDADIATDGRTGLEMALSGGYDLVILDIMLPSLDGFSITRKLRQQSSIPLLITSALGDDVDKIRGLGLGADDYMEKPFSPSLLVAKVASILSRCRRQGGDVKGQITIGEVSLNTLSRRVFARGREVELKNMEFELLLFLMEHVDEVFSRENIYENVWGMDKDGDNSTVAVHINRLREKLEEDPANPGIIQTVWGAGYRFSARGGC